MQASGKHGHISGLFRAYFRSISGLFRAYFRSISGLFRAYFRSISGLFRAYFGPISGLFRAYFRSISGLFRADFKPISGLFQAYFRSILSIVLTCRRSRWRSLERASWLRTAACQDGMRLRIALWWEDAWFCACFWLENDGFLS